MNSPLTAQSVAETAAAAGFALGPDAAARIAAGVGPAFAAFAAISGTLPLDLEPAAFTKVQHQPPEAGK